MTASGGVPPSSELLLVNASEIAWTDAEELFGEPGRGVLVKILARDPGDGDRTDYLLRVPAGKVEPAHTHEGRHVTVLIEGRVEVAGHTLHAPAYIYGPSNVEHGPFVYPVDCTLFGSMRGRPLHVEAGREARE